MHFPGEDELEAFPVVEDFLVEISEVLEFRSAEGGRLAGFPAWEHAERDLRHFDANDVPLGTIDEPFEDADEQWRMVIFEHRGHVYVLEGDSPHAEDFDVFFRVTRDRYFEAWAAVIDSFNPITPLDEV
jgi:hypothetical protein